VCKVVDDMDGVGDCDAVAPPDSFEPDVQWTWDGDNGDTQSIVLPLVGNLTDDNDDGEIDLCDVPDVVVVAFPDYFDWKDCRLHVLDGETGVEHWVSSVDVDAITAPALGDIDDDGVPEIVTVSSAGMLVAFEHDGTIAWTGDSAPDWAPATALADLDADGDVEIVVGPDVFDHTGKLLWHSSVQSPPNSANTAADLDDDGDLEVVYGHAALEHDGTVAWQAAGISPGYPQVADFDDDGDPEILISNADGLNLVEADGTVVYEKLTPNGDPGVGANWRRPSTVHDFDGDGAPEYAVSSADHYSLFEADAALVWSTDVDDGSGTAAGTAFDFLGDGVAEAMYADEFNLFVFDGDGAPLLSVPRSSGTGKEYPVVADVDNDGSAEIVVVSNDSYMGQPQTAAGVQVIRDEQDRWIQARRIWNQHTYHVTNVREDGTIPQDEPKSWELLNTFRTQAQILEGGGVCKPEG
jgi:hypothetical protein